MDARSRGLNITHYEEDDCFSMTSFIITFNSPDRKPIDENILHVINRVLYIFIKKTGYYKDGWFSDYMENKNFGEISFCLTPAVRDKEALRFVQLLFLELLGFNLRTKKIIDIIGQENLPKMESELAEAKEEIWALLGDITRGGLVKIDMERC